MKQRHAAVIEPPSPPFVLVIGVHREELAFGEQVVEGLPSGLVVVYRIPVGISGQRPRPDQSFHYCLRHKELYLQLRQQLKGRYGLLIDLHSGLDSEGPSADIFCRNRNLLNCVVRDTIKGTRPPAGAQRVRAIPLVASGSNRPRRLDAHSPDNGKARKRSDPLVGHPLIPPSVWDQPPPLYVALELYLHQPGAGSPADWALARHIIACIVDCARWKKDR